jgi:hypothetical protein
LIFIVTRSRVAGSDFAGCHICVGGLFSQIGPQTPNTLAFL